MATGQRGDRPPGPTRGSRQLPTARSQFVFRGPFAGARSGAAAELRRPPRRDAMASMPLRQVGAPLPTCKRAPPGSRRIRLSAIARRRGHRCQLRRLPQRMQERRKQRRRLIRDASVFAAAMPGRARVADWKPWRLRFLLGVLAQDRRCAQHGWRGRAGKPHPRFALRQERRRQRRGSGAKQIGKRRNRLRVGPLRHPLRPHQDAFRFLLG